MGTNSVIAIPQDSGFKGRFCHWDGYPTWMGINLHTLVRREGVETVRRVLTEEHYHWSSINADQVGEESTRGPRFAIVEGFGETNSDGDDNEWITNDGDNWGTEWAYVLNDDDVSVLVYHYGSDGWHHVTDVPYADEKPDWEAIERKGYES